MARRPAADAETDAEGSSTAACQSCGTSQPVGALRGAHCRVVRTGASVRSMTISHTMATMITEASAV